MKRWIAVMFLFTPAWGAANIAWTRFNDPLEQAFSLDVPQGWTVRGGMQRKGPIDPRGMIDVTSPDGRTNYRIGDSSIPPYTIPTQMGMQLGFREGSPYNAGGFQGMIAAYRTGPQYAVSYASVRFSAACPQMEIKSVRTATPVFPMGFNGDTAGEVVFKCPGSGKAGYVYAQTSLIGNVTSGLWTVPVIASFLALEGEAKSAMELLAHSAGSYRINPQWTQMQDRLIQQTNARSKAVADSSLEISRRQRAQMDRQLKLAQDFDDIINGETLTRDPTTGHTLTVRTGRNQNYWIGPLDRVANTPTDSPPGLNYRRLQTIPRSQQ